MCLSAALLYLQLSTAVGVDACFYDVGKWSFCRVFVTSQREQTIIFSVIYPRRACAARVTVVVLCVCVCGDKLVILTGSVSWSLQN